MQRTSTFFTLLVAAGPLTLLAACSSGGTSGTAATGAGGTPSSSSTAASTSSSSTSSSSSGTGGTSTSSGTGTGGSVADAGSDAAADAGSLCTQTGGTDALGLCCASQGDFPGTCSIGACSCPPANSHMIEMCTCPATQCYDKVKGCTPVSP